MAYSEAFPNVVVEYGGAGAWSGLTRYLHDYVFVDGGIVKTGQATIRLHNIDGMFTSVAGAQTLLLNETVRIREDVGVWSGVVFQGTIFDFDDEGIQGEATPRSQLTVIARSLHGQRCLRETISRDYEGGGRFIEEAIVDMVDDPDSHNNLLITLNDDGGAIATTLYPNNPRRQSILESIQDPCEDLGYVGYFSDISGAGADTGTLWLRRYRDVPTLRPVNPAIHLNLVDGLTQWRVLEDMENFGNYVMVWGGTDDAYPDVERWTDNGLARYLPRAWTAPNPNVGVIDSPAFPISVTTDGSYMYYPGNRNSIRGRWSGIGGVGSVDIRLNFGNTDYYRGWDGVAGEFDFSDGRFNAVDFWVIGQFFAPAVNWDLDVVLIDDLGNTATRTQNNLASLTWLHMINQFDDLGNAGASWAEVGAFRWGNVVEIRFIGDDTGVVVNLDAVYIDYLVFTASNWLIDPVIYSGFNPPHINAGSVGLYGRSMFHHEDDGINNFETAWYEGQRVLSGMSHPYHHIEITHGAGVWARPSQFLQVTILEWDISGVDYRINEITHRWSSASKLLRTTYDLIEYAGEVSSSRIRGDDFWGSLQIEDRL